MNHSLTYILFPLCDQDSAHKYSETLLQPFIFIYNNGINAIQKYSIFSYLRAKRAIIFRKNEIKKPCVITTYGFLLFRGIKELYYFTTIPRFFSKTFVAIKATIKYENINSYNCTWKVTVSFLLIYHIIT